MPKSKRIADVDKMRIFKCHNEGRDYRSFAENLGINIRSAAAIIKTMQGRNGIPSLPSGGAKHTKMDDEMRQELEDIIGEYPTMSIKEMNATLQTRLPNKIQVSDNCIAKCLDGMFFFNEKPAIVVLLVDV